MHHHFHRYSLILTFSKLFIKTMRYNKEKAYFLKITVTVKITVFFFNSSSQKWGTEKNVPHFRDEGNEQRRSLT